RLCLSWSVSPVATWSPVYSVSGGGNRGGVPVVLWSVVRSRRVCGRLRLCLSWPGSPVATWSPVYSVSGGGNRGGVPVVLWSVVRARRVCGRLRLCLSWPGSPVATWRTGGASLASPEGVQWRDSKTPPASPFCPRAPRVSGRQVLPSILPQTPRVSGQQVLPSILPQSPSGARSASSDGTPSVHPRLRPRVPAGLAAARSSVPMEDVTSCSSSRNSWEQQATPGVRTYTCDHCGKVCSTKAAIARHVLSHAGKTRLRGRSGPTEHTATHTGGRNHKCDHCGKTFARKSHLSSHILTHTGERKFQCLECGKRFTLKGDLHRHILTHTGRESSSAWSVGKDLP
ncbi:hypothetical protein O3P69_015647, partial [Scylla paramamosain]